MGEKKLLDSVSIVDTKTGITSEYEIADSKLRGRVDSALENVSADIYSRLTANNTAPTVMYDDKLVRKYGNIGNVIAENQTSYYEYKYVMNSDTTKEPSRVEEKYTKCSKIELFRGDYVISRFISKNAIVKPSNDNNYYNLLEYCKKTKYDNEQYNENSELFGLHTDCTLYVSYKVYETLRIYLVSGGQSVNGRYMPIYDFPMSSINLIALNGNYGEIKSLKTVVEMCKNGLKNEVKIMGDISSSLEPPSQVNAFHVIDFDAGYGLYNFWYNANIEFLGSAKMKFKLNELNNLFYYVDARSSKEYVTTEKYTANKTEADIIAEAKGKLSTRLYVLSTFCTLTIENADIELEGLAGLLTIPSATLKRQPPIHNGVVLRNCRIKSNSTSPLLYLHSLYYKNIVIDGCWLDTPNGDSVVWVLSDSTTDGNPNIPKRSNIKIINSWLSGMKILIEGNKDTVGEYSMVISNSVINSNNFVTNGVIKPEFDNISVQRWNNRFS